MNDTQGRTLRIIGELEDVFNVVGPACNMAYYITSISFIDKENTTATLIWDYAASEERLETHRRLDNELDRLHSFHYGKGD